MTIEIPLGLLQAIESGKCVLFLGAGIGQHLSTHGKPLPDAKALAHELCEKFKITPVNDDLALVSRVIELREGRANLESFVAKRLSDAQPDEILKWLLSLRWRSIYTTNYDESIKRAFELNSQIQQKPVIYTLSRHIVDYDPRVEVPVVYLHGTLYGETTSKIVISTDDYITYKEKRRMLFELLKRDAAIATILYIGYSNKDPNWNILINELRDEFFPSQLPTSYRISPSTDELNEAVLEAQGIKTIHADLASFCVDIKGKLTEPSAIADIQSHKNNVPNDFGTIFDEQPAATLRFFNSWAYINQAPFNQKSNLKAFLKGDKPNWSLMASSSYFERDAEEVLYDECLEYVTNPTKKPTITTVLAPAGYGVTTLLMSLCVRLVKQKAGRIYFLKEGANLIEGDIEFALSISGETPIFFIDNASAHKNKIVNLLHRLREQNNSALLVLGARKNEWYQAGFERLKSREFFIDPLSEGEIKKLIRFLEDHNSLGQLEGLPDDLRIAAVKTKLGKELLVTMREATEGVAFDAILDDEYRKIGLPLAQKIYLIVSCFYQFGSILRTGLLAELCDMQEGDLHPIINKYLEGVVVNEDINISRGIYGLRPRHRKIAEVIWGRCGQRVDQEAILQKSLSLLNLNYYNDKEAFEKFIQCDHLIDTISTLDGKIKFFETACKKDPTNSYIWQHYARMFSREGKYNLALDQIDKAISLDPKRILYHTKGEILAEMACTTEGIDVARKRLSQSEASFRAGLKIKQNDEYCVHGLASLYFRWAKFIQNVEERNEYLGKAEKEISEGLKIVQNKESLWILSSEIAKFLGNNPEQIRSLVKAIEASSGVGVYLPRYLLGRTYNSQDKFADAEKVLLPALRDNPEDFRLALEYAKSKVYSGAPVSEGISVLKLAATQGYKDARFIAMLGALLFLDGNYTESEQVFSEVNRQDFTLEEKRGFHFRPKSEKDFSLPLRVSGKVIFSKKGYALIQVIGYPKNIICPGSKWGDIILDSGMTVVCDLVFNAEGPLAINPEVQEQLL